MVQPNPYNRAFNFSNFQAQNPTDPLPGGAVDEELSRIKAVIDQIRTSIKFIQRDDFAIANDSVGFDQLKPEVQIGVNPPSTWQTLTNYVVRDTVFFEANFYICLVSHISGDFNTDLATGKWELIASFEAATSANSVSYSNVASGLAGDTVQEAIDELDGDVDALTTTLNNALSNLSADQVSFDPATATHTSATDLQAAVDDMDAAITAFTAPTGAVIDFAGATAPSGWLLCQGQAVSRTTFASLFALLGTFYGVGDGTTTFNLPDTRGRVVAGVDNGANRLTNSPAGGVLGTRGAVGGNQGHTLTTAQLAAHDHGGATFADGGHNHTATVGNVLVSAGGTGAFAAGGSGAAGNLNPAPNHTHGIPSDGSGAAHNNVQPTIVLTKIIKT